MPAAVEMEDAVLAMGIELRIGAVQILHGYVVTACNVGQRVTAFDRHIMGIVIGRTGASSSASVARSLQVLVECLRGGNVVRAVGSCNSSRLVYTHLFLRDCVAHIVECRVCCLSRWNARRDPRRGDQDHSATNRSGRRLHGGLKPNRSQRRNPIASQDRRVDFAVALVLDDTAISSIFAILFK
jgi:hypothetical protein